MRLRAPRIAKPYVRNYYFTSCADGSKTKVEYTFGYKKNADGNVRIFLHHSSVPFTSAPAAAPSNTISEKDVQKAQAAWANAIKLISKTYLGGGGCSQMICMQSTGGTLRILLGSPY